jgi:hypothetical protein
MSVCSGGTVVNLTLSHPYVRKVSEIDCQGPAVEADDFALPNEFKTRLGVIFIRYVAVCIHQR